MQPRLRTDLIYDRRELGGRTVVLVKDPIRMHYYEMNELKATIMELLDGQRSPEQITLVMRRQHGVDLPREKLDRFLAFLAEKLLLDVAAYTDQITPIRRPVYKALRREGISLRKRKRTTGGGRRTETEETHLFDRGLEHLDQGRAAASADCFAQILEVNPHNQRARRLRELVHEEFFRAHRTLPSHMRMIHLWNPDRFLTALDRRIGRWVFGPVGLGVLVALVLSSVQILPDLKFPPLSSFTVTSILVARFAIGNVNLLLHELGHGLACKHYGGKVESIGIMLFYGVLPGAYCDVTEVHQFRSRRHKVIVYLSGIAVELPLLCLWLLVYHFSAEHFWMRPAILVALLRGAYIVAINLVPLVVGYDGYYALTSAIDRPDLAERSYGYLRARLQKLVFGVDGGDAKTTAHERRIYLAFSLLGGAYFALFVFGLWFGFLFPLAIRYLHGLGLLLAVVYGMRLLGTKAVLATVALAKFVFRHRATIARPRRLLVIGGVAVAAVSSLALRFPLAMEGRMTVTPAVRAFIRGDEPGLIEEILVDEGDVVQAGRVLARLSNPQLERRQALLVQELEVQRQRLRRLRTVRPEELSVARARLRLSSRQADRRRGERNRSSQLRTALVASASAHDATERLADQASAGQSVAARDLALLLAGGGPHEVAAALATVAGLEAELEQLGRRRAGLVLRSPSAGVVVTARLHERRHAWLDRGALFCEVADLRQVRAEIFLPLDEPLGSISPGQRVLLRADGDPHREVATTLAQIRPMMTTASVATTGSPQPGGMVWADTATIVNPGWPSGFSGRARILGERRSLGYRWIGLPLLRVFDFKTWPVWG